MATVGVLITAVGVALATASLRGLAATACPRCRALGSLVIVSETAESHAATGTGVEWSRRCTACGATVRAMDPTRG